ncbi:MAG: trimeric intracellular cation channel family protein [Cohaesibacter sp.]|jgi:uncharacterized membrane protein YeiH|nr:trimeric intracellular cation channel family protein [Cohaesibacter sp.]
MDSPTLSHLLDNALPILTVAGLIVFAMSGGLRARQADMDIFGVITVGFVTAAGGGTLRDVLIGNVPVNWIVDPWPLAIILPSSLLAFGADRLEMSNRAILNWVDALGMATFCVTGAALSLSQGIHPVMAAMMGIITATFGGLLRDILCNVVPFVLRQEIYATAALLGAGLFVGLVSFGLDEGLSALAGMAAALALRGVALHYKLNVKADPSA